MIGEYRAVSCKYVKVGDVVYYPASGPCAVIQRQSRPRKGPHLLLETLDTRKRRSKWCSADEKVMRLHISQQASGPAKGWSMTAGDVVVYPGEPAARTVATIRHGGGWHGTNGVRVPQPDFKILTDVVEGQATIVRCNGLSRPDIGRPLHHRTGSVVALDDYRAPDPTAWVRIGIDHWKSTTGAEASDTMIDFEVNRKTYRFLWVPGR